jgi:hypothetical protein
MRAGTHTSPQSCPQMWPRVVRSVYVHTRPLHPTHRHAHMPCTLPFPDLQRMFGTAKPPPPRSPATTAGQRACSPQLPSGPSRTPTASLWDGACPVVGMVRWAMLAPVPLHVPVAPGSTVVAGKCDGVHWVCVCGRVGLPREVSMRYLLCVSRCCGWSCQVPRAGHHSGFGPVPVPVPVPGTWLLQLVEEGVGV